ncbi:hypothetical protein KHO57_gp088 [Mycobacterium phage Phabba]|uniref:Uncharacterized protein n=1 Tax=Mycobacterium phage Phabba TaxID=2027899 RepID=A0A249XSY7_9CAUD|nr:hypothetical protein KHO57_gp088 [Mycobacterium phage Phabba]ASZ74816.1 hypothetical protein SEA_PHABBA_279 [Mycobacterium phage Phabba]
MSVISWLNSPVKVKPKKRYVVILIAALQALAAYGRTQRQLDVEKRLKALEGRRITKVKLTDEQSRDLSAALKGVVDDAKVNRG